jgi:hypothetical protein
MAAAQVKKSPQNIPSVKVTVYKHTELHPYYTCRVMYRSVVYSSVMHAMAAQRFKNKARWSYGGDFDDWQEIRADINEELVAEGKDKETFHNMGDLIGMLAEHVRVRPRRYKLERCNFPAFTWEAALFDVYGGKFMTNGKLNHLGKSLLDTTGRIKINGFSIFGKILTEWRDKQKELLGKRKRDDEIEFVKKRTIEDKFAEAAANGSVVDLASEDAPAGSSSGTSGPLGRSASSPSGVWIKDPADPREPSALAPAPAAPAAPAPAYKSMPDGSAGGSASLGLEDPAASPKGVYSNLFGSDDEAEAVAALPLALRAQAELLCVPPVKVTRKNFLTHYPAWVIKEVVRQGGASAGHIDYQYISPSGKVLRSIKEVVGFYF